MKLRQVKVRPPKKLKTRQNNMRSKATRSSTAHPRKTTSLSATFLSLPAEIRLEILQLTLCSPEPITVGEKVPALLTVCHQLRQEASILFYERNVFDIVLFDDDTRGADFKCLHHQWNAEILEKFGVPFVLRRARKFRIVLRGCQKSFPIDDDDSFDDRQAVHQLCALMRDILRPKMTTIAIKVEYKREYSDDNQIMDRVLQPFTFLRGLAEARVAGVDVAYASYVADRMESSDEAEDIWKMKDAFWAWCEYRSPTTDVVDEIGAQALEAINDCDVARFKTEREKAVKQLAGRHLRSTRQMYLYDIVRPASVYSRSILTEMKA